MRSVLRIESYRRLHLIGIAICCLPFITSAYALMLGILFSLLDKKEKRLDTVFASNGLLKGSIILMGFGMNWSGVMDASVSSLAFTCFMICLTLGIGLLLARFLRLDKKTALLITAGTAICGGSAIAAVSPVIEAKKDQFSFALLVIFLFNALSLILFPAIGNALGLSQLLFGNWAAIAIHDTSSVVGAAGAYGEEALLVATSVKLSRALWIVPMVIMIGLFRRHGDFGKVRIPWFIFLFVSAMLLAHMFPQFPEVFEFCYRLGKKGLVPVLFFIGFSVSFSKMKTIGLRYFIMGGSLWAVISFISLLILKSYLFPGL